MTMILMSMSINYDVIKLYRNIWICCLCECVHFFFSLSFFSFRIMCAFGANQVNKMIKIDMMNTDQSRQDDSRYIVFLLKKTLKQQMLA